MAIEYKKTFIKKDGGQRTMKFVRLKELTASDYENYSIPPPSGNSKPKKFAEGMETVWDLECEDFRVFNWSTVVDK